MLTLDDVKKNRGVVTVAHVSPDSDDFVSVVNEACRRLADYGNWWGTVEKVRLQCNHSMMVWPRWVGTVLAVDPSRYGNNPPMNGWYDFLPLDSNDWGRIASHYHNWQGLRDGQRNLAFINDVGTTCVNQNIYADTANYIRLYRRNALDDGKLITFYGLDSNGQDASETVTCGMGAANVGYVQTSTAWTKILRVRKEATSGYLDCYQYNPTTGLLYPLAHYSGGETNPEYRMSHVNGCSNSCCFDVMIKLRHIDAVSGSDRMTIGNMAAIKLMVQAIYVEEGTDPEKAVAMQTMAIKELNRELNNNLPVEQIPVSDTSFGGINLQSHSMF